MALANGLAGPGEWIGVLGERVTAVLPPQAAELAARLWVVVDQGAGFDEALDAVLREGLAGVPSLVLLEEGPDRLRLLVRGTPRVRVLRADDGVQEVGSGSTTWTEEFVQDVVGLQVELPGALGALGHEAPGHGAGHGRPADGRPDEAVVPGLRRLGRLALGGPTLVSRDVGDPGWRATVVPDGRPDAVPVPEPEVVPVPEPSPGPEPVPDPEPVPEPEPAVDEHGRPHAVPVKVKGSTAVPPVPPTPPAVPLPPVVPAPSRALADALSGIGDDGSDLETAPMVAAPAWAEESTPAWSADATDVLPPVPEPGTEAGTVPVPAEGDEPATDVLPAVPTDLPANRPATPPAGVPGEVDPAALVPGLAHARPEPVARLTFSHGLVLDLDGPVVIGRAPSPDAGTATGARTVTVPSPLAEVSANHAEIRPGAHPGQVEARDLGSTNGTVVLRRGQAPLELVPGAPLVLPDHAVLDLGDGATVTVTLV